MLVSPHRWLRRKSGEMAQMNIFNRRGRVRLRSASSQYPGESTVTCWYMPCGGSVKKIASYLVCMVIVAMLLLLNNFVLLYVQNSRRSNAVYTLEGKWPSIEHTKVMDPSLDIHDELKRGNKSKRSGIPEVTNPQNPPRATEGPELQGDMVKLFERTNVKMTPNELLQKSAILLVNTGKSCKLEEVVEGFLENYADIKVYIERYLTTESYCATRNNTVCVNLPDARKCRDTDCNRNRFIQAVLAKEQAEYIILWDAQYGCAEAHSLALLAKKYVETSAKIVSPCIQGYCNITSGALHLSKSSGELTALPGIYLPSAVSTRSSQCYITDLFPPVFLTSRNTLAALTWQKDIADDHHTDLLLDAHRRQLAVVVCRDIEVIHPEYLCTEDYIMDTSFTETWLRLPTEGFKKYQLQRIYNGLGEIFELQNREKVIQKAVEWITIKEHNSSTTSYLSTQQEVIKSINDRVPGWESVRLLNTGDSSKLRYKQVSPCVRRVAGPLPVEFDRHSTFKNKQSVIKVDLHLTNRSCPLFQQYWRLSNFGKLLRRHVYYVTVVSNDSEYMARLLRLVQAQNDRQFARLVLVDMGTQGNEFNITKYRDINLDIHYLYLGAPFSRSIGLKRGFEVALEKAKLEKHKNPILFSIDASMIIPKDFTRRIWRSTRCGVSTYAPICYKTKTQGGYWAQFGYGMVGVCASDYMHTSGWDPKWGYHWGAEDVDLIHRLQDDLPYTVRIRETEYIHQHNEEYRKNNEEYYRNKNVFPSGLPVTPLTINMADPSLKDLLYKYTTKRMKYKLALEMTAVYQTALIRPEGGVTYDIRFKNSNNEEYYALVQSV